MKLLLTGASGFVGQAVISKLMTDGHELVLVSRTPSKLEARYGNLHTYYFWDALSGVPDKEVFNGIDGIINLMGESVANKRWTTQQKQKITDSRVKGTENLMNGARKYAKDLKVIVSASAIGYYDHFQDDVIDESSPASNSFLGQLCQDWEKAAKSITQDRDVRMVIFRIGVVLGKGGGVMAKMIPPFSWGLGGKMGSGKQWMNWIHREDLSSLIADSIKDDTFSDVYNAVSPQNIQNEAFSKTLGRLLKRPAFFHVPSFMIRLLLGEFSVEVLSGKKIVSTRLAKTGYPFKFSNIHDALEEVLSL